MELVSWFLVGGLVGWFFYKVTGKKTSNQFIDNVAVGIIGGLLANITVLIANVFLVNNIDVQKIVIALVGSFIFLTTKEILTTSKKATNK
ncbi:hypothetical protein KC874_03090 [Candidatus Saccharibacteria bacterium]|nr:hypothetical protein [Candidatus Saccharibacteria bacterium]